MRKDAFAGRNTQQFSIPIFVSHELICYPIYPYYVLCLVLSMSGLFKNWPGPQEFCSSSDIPSCQCNEFQHRTHNPESRKYQIINTVQKQFYWKSKVWYLCNGKVDVNRTSGMPKSVLHYLLDKDQYFGLEFSLYPFFLPNEKAVSPLRVELNDYTWAPITNGKDTGTKGLT